MSDKLHLTPETEFRHNDLDEEFEGRNKRESSSA